jgi:ferritin-like metal-binding protein YciE
MPGQDRNHDTEIRKNCVPTCKDINAMNSMLQDKTIKEHMNIQVYNTLIQMAQSRLQWQALQNIEMNLQVPQKMGNFLIS